MLDVGAPVPDGLEHARFVAVPLTPGVAVPDYDAYMSSPDVIRVHSDGRWPVEGFTFEDDLRQVTQHQSDHEARRSFAFTLLDPSRQLGLGCVYLNPLRDYLGRVGASSELVESLPETSAMVTFWLRQDRQDSGLPEAVVTAIDAWLHTAWPFDRHVFRVLPDERSSCAALDALGLPQVILTLPDESRPYRWYGSPSV